MMNRLFRSLEHDPYTNIAMEKLLFQKADDGVALLLWQNRPAVIIGRNQNIWAECDLRYMQEQDILPVRRFSGGGAVFHDLGNLNFTFITKEEHADEERFLSVIKQAMDRIGLASQLSGRNDILCDGKKFSGHAYLVENGNYLYHGTIMVAVDLSVLEKAITPSNMKLQSKGISSARSRVMNLREKLPSITIEQMGAAFAQSFGEVFGVSLPFQEVQADKETLQLAKKLSSQNWIFGECPQFSVQMEEKFGRQLLTVNLVVENGRIMKAKVYTDSLQIGIAERIEREVLHQEFERNKIVLLLEKICI